MNILTPFEYHKPATKAEALALLADLENVKVIAGGTDLVIQMKEKLVKPDHVVDISGIDELKVFDLSGEGGVLGSCTTLAKGEFSEELKAKYPAFAYACGELAGPQIREMATIGGNLSHSSPSAETPCSLIAYDATLVLESRDGGEREIKVVDFIHGNRQNDLKKGEIITKILLPAPKANTVVKYGYVGLRSAMEIDMANMAIRLTVENGKVTDAFCVMGSVFIKPLVAQKLPELMIGKELTEDIIKAAAEANMEEVKPITDVRATAQYRKDVIGALTRRLFREALAELK